MMFDVTVVAPSCIINGNTQIAVDFGADVDITRLGEAGYKSTPIDFTLACNAPGGYSLTVQGTGVAFDGSVLATDKQNLGIEITHDGVRFPLNTRLSFTYPNIPALQAQPVVSRTGSPSVGEFSATATMRVNYD